MKRFLLTVLAAILMVPMLSAGNYKSFTVAIYARAYEVDKMSDPHYLDSTWNIISKQMKVDKIYLETHRDKLIVPQKTIDAAKKFFKSKGLEVAGGITYTINDGNNFQTFSYATPEAAQLAREIERVSAARGLISDVLLEINIADEASKHGTGETSAEELLRAAAALPHLRVRGLMAVPPPADTPEENRPYFRKMRQLQEKLKALGLPGVQLSELSMGMTGDFETAIEEGSTMIRIGTAVFGRRLYHLPEEDR